MKRGEMLIFALIGVSVVLLTGVEYLQSRNTKGADPGIPFYSTSSAELSREAGQLIRRENCRDCHSLWAMRDPTQAVPAPMLDGIGILHDEAWFYRYFSAAAPQTILPSRLKKQYRMPSYAALPEQERKVLAGYMASLQVKDWYRDNVVKAEHSALTGQD